MPHPSYDKAVRDGQKKEQKEQFINPLLSGPSASMAVGVGAVHNIAEKMIMVGDEHVKAVSASGSKKSSGRKSNSKKKK